MSAWWLTCGIPVDGPWPTLLQRLPYGRSVASAPVMPSPTELARLGYTVVVQDVRGRGDSEGVFEPFRQEASDGAATIEWASALPWSNGDVVTYGYSYQGLIQLLAAARRPPHLRGVAALMCGSEPYEGWTYRGGCLQWSFVADWAAQLLAQAPGAVPRAPDLEAIPLSTALGPDPPALVARLAGASRRRRVLGLLRPDLSRIDVPVFTVVGYFDQFAAGTARLASSRSGRRPCSGRGPTCRGGPATATSSWARRPSPVKAIDAMVGFFDRVLRPNAKGLPLAPSTGIPRAGAAGGCRRDGRRRPPGNGGPRSAGAAPTPATATVAWSSAPRGPRLTTWATCWWQNRSSPTRAT